MKKRLLIICCIFIIISCKNNNRIPSDIIPPKKMQEVVWDMMRADLFLGDFVFRTDSSLDKKTERSVLYGRVFTIHHISKEQFGESFSFYKTHPLLFKSIMDSLSRPKTDAPTEMIKQPAVRDSVQHLVPGTSPVDSITPVRKKKIKVAE